MKKLMVMASAALCAAVGFCVESANIVGYAQGALRAGSIGIGAQFIPVGGGEMDLTDIVPTGYNKDTYDGGSIYVQSLDASGNTVAGSKYYWYDDEDGTGWFDASDEEVLPGQVTYAPGEAIWVRGNSASEAFTTSGQVASGSIDVYLRAGSKLVCNPTPVAIPFNDDNNDGKFIAPGGYGTSYEGGSIYVQKLDAQGMTVAGSKYFWYDDEDGTAWFDQNDEEVADATLGAGEAIWVRGNATTEKINFPAAL